MEEESKKAWLGLWREAQEACFLNLTYQLTALEADASHAWWGQLLMKTLMTIIMTIKIMKASSPLFQEMCS